MFLKIGVFKIFYKFHRKTPVLESLFNKVAGLQRTPFYTEHLRWMLLDTAEAFFQMCFVKTVFLKFFAEFTRKHRWRGVSFNKVVD